MPAITLRDDEPPPQPIQPEESPPSARYVGRYRVVSRLGDGGMGSIFRVVDAEGQALALKRLHSRASRSARERFRREAEILHRLSHPHVVKVFDLNVDEQGRPYFTMELVEGSTLQQLKGRLEPDVFVNIVAKAAEGLHHAHEHGLVHRDVKPHNIVVARGGEPKVVDFGLAHDVTANPLTQEGDLLGTPLYMAPEQMRGEHDKVDRRADVYSLGALLYEGLCGRLPFAAATLVELKELIERGEILPPSSLEPSISPALEAVVMRALSQDPSQRQDTALTLSLELRRALRRPQDAPSPRRAPGRLRWIALIVGLFGVLSLSLAGALFLKRRAASAERAQARDAARAELERGRGALAGVEGQAEHAAAVALAREARGLASGVLDPERLAGLDDADAAALTDEARALESQAIAALTETLALGPYGEREEARALLHASLEADPEQLAAWTTLAQLELIDGRLSRVRAAAHEVTKREPKHGLGQYLLGRALVSLGEPGPGIAALERALAGTLDGVSRVDVFALLGMAHLARDDLAAARAAARDARQSGGESSVLTVLEADLALRAKGDEPLACRLLEGLVATETTDPLGWQAVVQYLVQAEDWAGAAGWLDARLARDPNPRLLILRGGLHQLLEEWEAAEALFAQAVEAVPPGEPLYERLVFDRARLFWLEGRLDEGIELLEQVAGEGLILQSLNYELASLLLARDGAQDVERAAELIADLTSIPEDDRGVFEWRIALARGDLEGAERARRRTLSELAEHPYVLMLEARHLAALGRSDQFGVLLERSRKRFPRVFGARVLPSISFRSLFTAALERVQRGCVILRRARARGSSEQLARAGRHFRAAYRLVPELACAGLLAAVVAAEEGAPPQEVLAALERLEAPEILLVGMPEFPPAPQQLEELRGRQLLRSGSPAEAAAAYSRALDYSAPAEFGRRSRRARILVERAEAYEATGQREAALSDLDQALELEAGSEEARARRQQLREDLGDAAGAQADAQALAELRAGPTEEVAAALEGLARATDAASAAQWLGILRELRDALRPHEHGELFAQVCRARGEALLRFEGPGAAYDDLAALCQYDPRGLEVFYDLEVERFSGAQERSAILRVLREAPEVSQLVPGFRIGLSGWLLAEFARLEGKAAAAALWSYQLGGEDCSSAALALCGLHLALGYPARARAELADVLAQPDSPPYAHYLHARLLTLPGREQAALEALSAAWDGGFQPPKGYGQDPYLEPLRDQPAFARFVR
ncbi:MAG: protein kinase [Planctomycetota bacterium]